MLEIDHLPLQTRYRKGVRRSVLSAVLALATGCSLLIPLDGLQGQEEANGVEASSDGGTASNDAGAPSNDADVSGDAGACVEPGLVAYYRFDDTADVLHNCVPDAGLDAVIKKSAALVPGGISGSALKLLTRDGYAEIQGSHPVFAQGPITVSVWINVQSYDNHGRILSNRAPSDAGGSLTSTSLDLAVEGTNVADGGVGFYVSTNENWVLGQLARRTWMHVAGVYRVSSGSATSEIWVDGKLVRKLPDTRESSSVAMRIGNEYRPQSYGFDGLIDELRIYDRALESAELEALAKR